MIRTLRNMALRFPSSDPISNHCLGFAVCRLAVIRIYGRQKFAATIVRKPGKDGALDSCPHMITKVVRLEWIEINCDAVAEDFPAQGKIGRASCRERVCPYV